MRASEQMGELAAEPLVRRAADARGVVTLTLNRPQAFNALSEGLLAALQAELDALAADATVRGPGSSTTSGCSRNARA
jgi:enoyl-CoA hydratase/carnithine racemase